MEPMISKNKEFFELINHRISENWRSFSILFEMKHYSNCISILCQSLDQYVRILYLSKQRDDIRTQLIQCSINNHKWFTLDDDGKKYLVSESVINRFADKLNGWELDIYNFRLSFNKINSFSNYMLKDPIKCLDLSGKKIVKLYIKKYHNIEISDQFSLDDIIEFLPIIIKKINDKIHDQLNTMTINTIMSPRNRTD